MAKKAKAVEVVIDPKNPAVPQPSAPQTKEDLQIIIDRFKAENPEGYARRAETLEAQLAALPSASDAPADAPTE